jgi:glycosyltransferase involved in cell wall biosynthesis
VNLQSAVRRVGSLVGRALLAQPWAIRGDVAQDLSYRSLQRAGTDPATVRLVRSGNSQAARVGLRHATGRGRPAVSAEQLRDRMEGCRDVSLLLDAAAYARTFGLEAPRKEWLARAAAGSLTSKQLSILLDEASRLPDEERDEVFGSAEANLSDESRRAIEVVRSTWRRIDEGGGAAVLGEAAKDVDVRQAAAYRAAALGYDDLLLLGRSLQGDEDLEPDAVLHVARALRGAGDFRVSAGLARQVLDRQPSNVSARSLSKNGQSAVTSIDEGWRAPEASTETAEPVRSGTIPYLLHAALPQGTMGYATRSHGLLSALREQGWQVEGVTRPGFPLDDPKVDEAPDTDHVDGVAYHHVLTKERRPAPLFPLDRGVARFSRAVRDLYKGVDVPLVHGASNYRVGMPAIHAARTLGVPSVYEVRGLWEYTRLAREPWFDRSDMFEFISRMETSAAQEADHVIAITQALADLLVSRGVDGEKISVVPNGVDSRRFEPRPRDEDLAAELGIGDRPVIGYIGSLLEYEGLDLLIDAARQVRATRDDFVVMIVGDGRSLPGLREQATELGLDQHVRFTGRVPHHEVERYYSLIDIAPFPRLPQTVTELVSPLKPFEAMAMDKTVVASDVAALAEIIDDGVTGRLFPKGDAAGLARVLEELLEDQGETEKIAGRGRDWVLRERDWRTVATRISAVYERLGVTRP